MALAGVAWGAHSLAGRRTLDAIATNADNFLRSAPFAAGICDGAAVDLGDGHPARAPGGAGRIR